MAETVGQLLIKVGADLGDTTAKLKEAEKGLNDLKASATDAAGSLQPAGDAAKDLSKNIETLGKIDISSSLSGAATGTAKLADNTRDLDSAMGDASRVANDLSKSFVELATGGDVSAAQIFKSTKAILGLRESINSLSDARSAVDAVNAGIAEFQKAKAAEATFSGIASSISDLGAAALKFSPIAIAGGAAVALFSAGLKQWREEIDKTNAKTKEWSDTVAKGTKEIQDKVAAIKFDASIAGLSAFEQQTARGVHEIEQLGLASGAAAGQVQAAVDEFKKAQAEISFQDAAKESRAAGAEITANIRKAADDGLKAFKELEDGLKLPGIAAVETQMQSLATKMNFQPAILSLQNFNTALATNATAMNTNAAAAGTAQEAIRGQVQQTSDFVASLPAGTIKITLDSSEAKAAAEKVAADFATLSKGFTLPLQVSNEDKVAALMDNLRGLAKELNFKGPIADINTLNAALEANTAKVKATGAQAGLTEEEIRKEVAKTNQELKDRFAQEQILKVNIDPSAAKNAVDQFLADIEHKPPTNVPFNAQFDLEQTVAELDTVRSKIVDTPEGEFKIALKAKADELEKKIADDKALIAKGETMPVDADTTEADKAIAEARARAAEPITLGFGAIHGEAANAADIQNTIDRLRSDLVAAIKSGDTAQQAILRAGGLEFVKTFGPTGGITASERKQILDIIGPFASIGAAQLTTKAATAFAGDPAILQAQQDVKKAQLDGNAKTDKTNALLTEQNRIAQEQLAATRSGTFGAQAVGAAINQLAKASTTQATGNRNG